MSDYDVVIVGSGFGGAVSAARLAEQGMSVCVFERGRAYAPGDFPRSPYDVSKSLWDPSEGLYGLYNVWSFPGVGALVASGLGGGSLIYANVLLRKDEETFVEDGRPWPVNREELDPHYDAVEDALGGMRYPFEHAPYSGTRKTRAMEAAAEALKTRPEYGDAQWTLPKLAVSFADESGAFRPGVSAGAAGPSVHEKPHPRLTCLLTGECDLGCNFGAKNTLDLTYLGRAKATGRCTIRVCCEVRSIGRDAAGYRVAFLDHGQLVADGRPRRGLRDQVVTARRVVVAAGTFGSTFLLLRSREALGGLPAAIGTRFSGNGDLLSFILKARHRVSGAPRVLEASYGPVITSAIRVPASERRRGHYVEDAGYPYLVSWLAELTTLPSLVRRGAREQVGRALSRLVGRSVDTDLGAEFAAILGETILSSTSMPLLTMGRDMPSGRFGLEADRLTVDWSAEESAAYFAEIEATLEAIAEVLGASFNDSRIRGLTKLVTVHPLGGCPMDDDKRRGVVDAWGRVHGHRGLYVADGSVMPGPVGPNPSLTIAALADRFSCGVLDDR